MEDTRWLRLITIGLVLAALAIGYFLLSGRFSPGSIIKTQASPTPFVLGQNARTTPTPTPTSSPVSAYSRIVDRTQSRTQTLPNTGFPMGLAVIFSISGMIAGLGLRRFPH